MIKLKKILTEGSNAKTNYYYLNKNIENVLDKISDDTTFKIDDLMGHDYYEKVSKKYSDEIWKLAFYHPIHDNWQPKDQAKIVETELDKMITTIEKDLNKKINKLISDLKKGANDVKKEIKISLQEK